MARMKDALLELEYYGIDPETPDALALLLEKRKESHGH